MSAFPNRPSRSDRDAEGNNRPHPRLATPAQLDLAKQLLADLPAPVFFIPREHDIVNGIGPQPFITAFGKDTKGDGWFSFDLRRVHVIGLVNVVHLAEQGQGTLGSNQLDWLKADLAGQSSSTPIVLLSHFPLWALYPEPRGTPISPLPSLPGLAR
jgi:3',5'-cyclic AMP phosphodiesterase CpdA